MVKATAHADVRFREQLQAHPTLTQSRYGMEHVDGRGGMKSEGEGYSTLLPSHRSTVVGVAFSECQLRPASPSSQNEGSCSL